ncbi:MAG TPA: O-antigen ligase family protein [Rubrivivax sp.]|nr:O-antigen ligase family protein [Rubrivivax sp.]
MTDDTPRRWLSRVALVMSWVLYLPLGAKYATWLLAAGLGGLALAHAAGRATFWREPVTLPALLLVGWLGLSGLWSPAPASLIAAHFGHYALLLVLPLVAAALPAAAAARALRHFCFASGVVGLLLLMEPMHLLPPSWLWHTTVDAEGNQRIANSLLLATGAALSLWQVTQTPALRARMGWVGLAALIGAGLAVQDRRTGLLALPLILLVWSWAAPVAPLRRVGLAVAVGACALATWQFSDNVRARFDEGLRELRQYQSTDHVANSWGQRVRMVEVTGRMVAEAPFLGHGLASWRLLWQQRVQAGTQLHDETTPHNEYLLLAQQAGVPAVLLLLWLIGTACRRASLAGQAGIPSLMIWASFAAAALGNAVLRDAKFSLPLLMVAACCAAAQQQAARSR